MNPATDHTAYREVLASLVAKTQAKFPALNGRLSSATKLALLDDVELHPDGSATVHSASDPSKTYQIVEGMCTWRDWGQAPEHLCQHRLAAGLVRKAHAMVPGRDGQSTRETPPLPEAQASANLRVMFHGFETQLTLRDHHEAALLARLEALLERHDLRPVPKPAPRTGG